MNAALLESLDPIQRAEFDAQQVRHWRVTWPSGSSEIIDGHMIQTHFSQANDGVVVATFRWVFLSAHRMINLSHVRDIEEVQAHHDPQDSGLRP